MVLDVKQNLISSYAQNMTIQPPSLLERRIELCNELLDVLKIVEPGISRLQGRDLIFKNKIYIFAKFN